MPNLSSTLMLALLLSAAHASAEQPWYPSKYGPNDTIGAANNLSPTIVQQAAKLVTSGKVYELGINIGSLQGEIKQPFAHHSYSITVVPERINRTIGHDDVVHVWMGGFGSSMDGLGHLGIDDRYYNGIKAEDIYAVDGLRMLATNDIPPLVMRGVLLDFARHLGVERVAKSVAFNRAEIEAVAKRQNISIRAGDVVLIHTGWLPSLIADGSLFVHQPGLGVDGARYLAHEGVVAVGADNQGVEALPPESPDPDFPFPVHKLLLAQHGVYILEDIKTEELARDRVYEFLFVLGQPKFVGAAQVPINPIAIR